MLEIHGNQERQIMEHRKSITKFHSKATQDSYSASIIDSHSSKHIHGKQPFQRSNSQRFTSDDRMVLRDLSEKRFEHVTKPTLQNIDGILYEMRPAKQHVVETVRLQRDKPRPRTSQIDVSYELQDRDEHSNYISKQYNEDVTFIDGEMYKKISIPKRTIDRSIRQRALTMTPTTLHMRNTIQVPSYQPGYTKEFHRYISREEDNDSGTAPNKLSLKNMDDSQFEKFCGMPKAFSKLKKNPASFSTRKMMNEYKKPVYYEKYPTSELSHEDNDMIPASLSMRDSTDTQHDPDYREKHSLYNTTHQSEGAKKFYPGRLEHFNGESTSNHGESTSNHKNLQDDNGNFYDMSSSSVREVNMAHGPTFDSIQDKPNMDGLNCSITEKKKTTRQYNPNHTYWYSKWNEAYQMVILKTPTSSEDKKKLKQWMYNCKNIIMTDDMKAKAWQIGVFSMYTDEDIILNSERFDSSLSFQNWKKTYIKKRKAFSEEHKQMLVSRKIFTLAQLNAPIRVNIDRSNTKRRREGE